MLLIMFVNVINLLKGQVFVLFEGGWFWKLRMLFLVVGDDVFMLESISQIVGYMQKNYCIGDEWWLGGVMLGDCMIEEVEGEEE